MRGTCANCDAYGGENIDVGGKPYGTCRGDLPTIKRVMSGDPDTRRPPPQHLGEHPLVAQSHWCRRWAAKDGTTTTAATIAVGEPEPLTKE